ncbi:MAG: hypothetical protein GY895_17975 [Phycisphaera sp.]|nr:hypothetical protein [Phycisphaera sp.]
MIVPPMRTIGRFLVPLVVSALVLHFASAASVASGWGDDGAVEDAFPTVDRVTSSEIEAGWDRLHELVALATRLDQPALVGLSGTLEQASDVIRPFAEGGGVVGEWFIRTPDGTTIACAVEEPPAPSPVAGTVVELVGFPAGMLEATGRDGVGRTWPLFVARFSGVAAMPSGGSPLPYIVGGVLLLLAAWMVLVVRTRRLVRGDAVVTPRTIEAMEAAEEFETGLPEDPAEAMSVLAARNENQSESNATESRG